MYRSKIIDSENYDSDTNISMLTCFLLSSLASASSSSVRLYIALAVLNCSSAKAGSSGTWGLDLFCKRCISCRYIAR